jgi:hypothetical protein
MPTDGGCILGILVGIHFLAKVNNLVFQLSLLTIMAQPNPFFAMMPGGYVCFDAIPPPVRLWYEWGVIVHSLRPHFVDHWISAFSSNKGKRHAVV